MTTTEEWRVRRDAAVWSPGGIATLAATHWLDPTPRSFDGVPGHWHAEDGRAMGSLTSGDVSLAPGERWESGDLELRGFEASLLRVFSRCTGGCGSGGTAAAWPAMQGSPLNAWRCTSGGRLLHFFFQGLGPHEKLDAHPIHHKKNAKF